MTCTMQDKDGEIHGKPGKLFPLQGHEGLTQEEVSCVCQRLQGRDG